MSRATLYQGEAAEVVARLPEQSVQCCVTSPPYWGLRDYGTGRWQGGDSSCSHREVPPQNRPGRETPGGRGGTFPTSERAYRDVCGKCQAVRVDAQLGLEGTPGEYVEKMVAVFAAVRRVLRDDGVLWLNLGDSYAGSGKGPAGNLGAMHDERNLWKTNGGAVSGNVPLGLKPKDLVGIPWRVAFALQADGWYLRSDVIWSKPNPMPESVSDRPTKSHEYLFLLSKSQKYFYDAAAVAEEAQNLPSWNDVEHSLPDGHRPGTLRAGLHLIQPSTTRNARSVWTIATQPYPSAHFATFPEELARRCILAGARAGDTVLDPFGGSGTVAQVATGNGRGSIYIDLNPQYLELARQRIGPMFCDEGVV